MIRQISVSVCNPPLGTISSIGFFTLKSFHEMKKPTVVKAAAQMWPRLVFDFDGKASVKECLREPGVYVLFREDEPYYVGKTKNKLYTRIKSHATKTRDRYYHFWNYFSAYVVPDPKHRDEVEGI